LIVILSFAASSPANAYFADGERITSFKSDITVNKDSTLSVQETIDVQTNNETIKHGIYRDYPTDYRNPLGLNYVVDLKVVKVTRDNKPEKYSVQSMPNGYRIYIGDENVTIPAGKYSYEFDYTVDRMLGFFADKDELYYNITGNGWSYPIDKVESRIVLPFNVEKKDLKIDSYFGSTNSKDQSVASTVTTSNNQTIVTTKTTKVLELKQGFSMSVGWPKGNVTAPTFIQDAAFMIKNNLLLVFGVAGLFVISLFYFLAWWFFGRDTKTKTVIPLFSPPNNMSPAGVRYLNRMGFDDKCMTANVVDLAVKGLVTIVKDKEDYAIKNNNVEKMILPEDEAKLYKSMFKNEIDLSEDKNEFMMIEIMGKLAEQFGEEDTKKQLKITQSNWRRLGAIVKKFKKNMDELWGAKNVIKNTKYRIIPLIWSVLLVGIIFFSSFFAVAVEGNKSYDSGESIPLFLVIFWNVIISVFVYGVVKLWIKYFQTKKLANLLAAIPITVFMSFFIIPGIYLIYAAGWLQSIIVLFVVFGTWGVNMWGASALKIRSAEGVKLQNEIDGFKMFLDTTDRLKIKKMYPDLPLNFTTYEKYLPYAIALDLESKWSQTFADEISEHQLDTDVNKAGWYMGGSSMAFSSSSFASGFSSSFSSAISSSSSAPGSSSGGGGGGSSGGGGGGGGGGGW
jgi:uncharacterized membrane protein YgcG